MRRHWRQVDTDAACNVTQTAEEGNVVIFLVGSNFQASESKNTV